jgi:hypothetical protein
VLHFICDEVCGPTLISTSIIRNRPLQLDFSVLNLTPLLLVSIFLNCHRISKCNWYFRKRKVSESKAVTRFSTLNYKRVVSEFSLSTNAYVIILTSDMIFIIVLELQSETIEACNKLWYEIILKPFSRSIILCRYSINNSEIEVRIVYQYIVLYKFFIFFYMKVKYNNEILFADYVHNSSLSSFLCLFFLRASIAIDWSWNTLGLL